MPRIFDERIEKHLYKRKYQTTAGTWTISYHAIFRDWKKNRRCFMLGADLEVARNRLKDLEARNARQEKLSVPIEPRGRLRNAKAKGNQRELRTMELLEKAGFKCTRSSRSLGCWDVVAISGSGILLVQVKSNRPPGREEMQRLREFEAPANAQKLVHIWHRRARQPEVREV